MPLIALALACVMLACAQTSDEDFKVYAEHPRLFLKPQKLKLLRRERERQSQRWEQFETLVKGKAQFPEPGFALALYYVTTLDQQVGRQAVEFALTPAADARQIAFVYDWCDALLTTAERARLAERLKQAARSTPRDIESARTSALAAIAADEPSALRTIIQAWWRAGMAPELKAGKRTLRHSEVYPLAELMAAVRDNLQIDLRDDALPAFKDFALKRILSYYPAVYPAPENEFHIPYYSGRGEPDLRVAALSRAAELALVAYDNNAQDMQFLQGWLMHDRFMLRGPFGAPYEFLWANPYQPGLPFEKMALWFHDPVSGMLLVRSSWEEDALWAGVFGGTGQIFREGQIQPLTLKQPVSLGETMLVGGVTETRFAVQDEARQWFIVGLKAATTYDIEVDDEDMTEETSDASGILHLEFTRTEGQTARIREKGAALQK